MQPHQISAGLVIMLALIAAIVSVGLIAGYTMMPLIISYWLVLTMKNLVDYIGTRR